MLGVIATKRDYMEDICQLTVDGKVEWCKEPELVMLSLSHQINQPKTALPLDFLLSKTTQCPYCLPGLSVSCRPQYPYCYIWPGRIRFAIWCLGGPLEWLEWSLWLLGGNEGVKKVFGVVYWAAARLCYCIKQGGGSGGNQEHLSGRPGIWTCILESERSGLASWDRKCKIMVFLLQGLILSHNTGCGSSRKSSGTQTPATSLIHHF